MLFGTPGRIIPGSCPTPFRPCYARSKLLQAILYSGLLPYTFQAVLCTFKIAPGNFVFRAPALHLSGRAAHVQNCSRQFCIPGSCPTPFRPCCLRLRRPMLYPSELQAQYHILFGTPGRIRTCYPRLRRPMLYPSELQAQIYKPVLHFH